MSVWLLLTQAARLSAPQSGTSWVYRFFFSLLSSLSIDVLIGRGNRSFTGSMLASQGVLVHPYGVPVILPAAPYFPGLIQVIQGLFQQAT